MNIKSLIRVLKYQFYWKNRPVEYAAMLGVNFSNMGETVRKLRPEPAFTQAIRPKS